MHFNKYAFIVRYNFATVQGSVKWFSPNLTKIALYRHNNFELIYRHFLNKENHICLFNFPNFLELLV